MTPPEISELFFPVTECAQKANKYWPAAVTPPAGTPVGQCALESNKHQIWKAPLANNWSTKVCRCTTLFFGYLKGLATVGLDKDQASAVMREGYVQQ
ncbi:hypothetical protein DK184_04980 [Pseudomonas sp. RW405]|nr:hypothetical protein DK184_04980 [Pseudomonas sp. RW405]